MFEKVFDEIKGNLKNPRLYVFLLIVALIILLLFPYIDANFFYYSRVDNRINILLSLSEVDIAKMENSEILLAEYESILLEIEKQSDGSLSSVFTKETNPTVLLNKFLTGGICFWILSIACLFIKNMKNVKQKIGGFLFFTVFGCIFGLIARAIPTIIAPEINYVGFPLIILIIIALLATMGRNNKGKKNDQTGID